MFYRIFLIMLFFVMNNCSPVNNVFLGPTVTAVKTGSVAQTSMSYTSSRLMSGLKDKVVIDNKKTLFFKNHHKS